MTENDNPGGRSAPQDLAVKIDCVEIGLGRRLRTLLDFGCGAGALVAFAQSRGVEAVGIDRLTATQISHISGRRFDAITMIEVIEHLPDPISVLETLVPLLNPDGVIYVESSFVDHLPDVFTAPYIDPGIGHRCVLSVKAVAYTARRFSLEVNWFNDNSFELSRPRGPLRRAKRATMRVQVTLRRRLRAVTRKARRLAARRLRQAR